MLKLEDAVALTKIRTFPSKNAPARVYERFGAAGEILSPNLPRITTEESERAFPARSRLAVADD